MMTRTVPMRTGGRIVHCLLCPTPVLTARTTRQCPPLRGGLKVSARTASSRRPRRTTRPRCLRHGSTRRERRTTSPTASSCSRRPMPSAPHPLLLPGTTSQHEPSAPATSKEKDRERRQHSCTRSRFCRQRRRIPWWRCPRRPRNGSTSVKRAKLADLKDVVRMDGEATEPWLQVGIGSSSAGGDDKSVRLE
jgi:hypothetical protein